MTVALQEKHSPVASAVHDLNLSRGVIRRSVGEIPDVDPEKRLTLARLAANLGELVAGKYEEDEHTDVALDIYRKNFDQAAIPAINAGLYVPFSSPAYPGAKLKIVCGSEPSTLELPGVVDRYTAVIFPADRRHKIARSPRDLADTAITKSLQKSLINPDRDEAEATAFRAAAHALDAKIYSMNSVENDIIEERQLLIRILNESRSTWKAHTKGKDLDKTRKEVDELIHYTAETASANLNIGTVAINAMHRAITSNLYRRGSRRDILNNWQAYVTMVGRYGNAQRGKIAQSRAASQKVLAVYAPYLELKPQSGN